MASRHCGVSSHGARSVPLAELAGSGQGASALPPRFRPSCDGCGKRLPVRGPHSGWAYQEGKTLVEREFCPQTKDECRSRYERSEGSVFQEEAPLSASASPAPAGLERDVPAPVEQLTFFDTGKVDPARGE